LRYEVNILAIDPATQMGWASVDGSKIRSGTISLHNSKWDGAGMRFLRFKQWLVHNLAGAELVVYERVENHSSTYSAHAYGGWIAVIQSVCEDKKIPYTGVSVQEIKKFWTGKGNAKKDAMVHEARKRGFNPADDNEADALAILHLGMTLFSLE